MPRFTRRRHLKSDRAKPEVASLGLRRSQTWVGMMACGALSLFALTDNSFAGTYVVKSCGEQGDNRAAAFSLERLTVRMFIRRGCNAVGRGKRGLLTRNSYARGGRVSRGSEARMVMNAPPGATFVGLKWAGEVYRPDCRYEAQVYARGPAGFSTVARNFRSYERCAETKSVRISGRKGAQNYPFRADASGRPIEATRIVQRIECVAKRSKPFCSNRRPNYVVTYRAYVTVKDETPPRGHILADTPLARGEWVNGRQPLNYEASDNVGVRKVQFGEVQADQRTCDDRLVVPCPNGRGQLSVDTSSLSEGSQALALRATDSASNIVDIANSQPIRVDRTAPGAVGLTLDGGEGWRSTNGFTARWTNPADPDRAPLIGARFELCPVGGGRCLEDRQAGDSISALPDLPVPTMGEWRLRMWREDQAGNQLKDNASLPVTLRFDGERPELGFEPTDTGDPTRLAAAVTDKVSGLAGGQVEISRAGSGNWQQLTTSMEGARLVARLDDGRLEPGAYAVRAFARDQAGNQGSTDRRLDGQPMVVRIPLRTATTLRAGIVRERRGGDLSSPRDRLRVGARRRASVVGSLTIDRGQPVGNAPIAVIGHAEGQPEFPIGTVRTGPRGRFRYRLPRGPSRTLRFNYAGTPVTLPAEAQVTLLVPASTTFSVSRRRLLNGGAVRFRGRLRAAQPGKLVEMQVRLSGRWQTFRTTRTGRSGRWGVRYRFRRTCGLARYRFRARLPKEQGYPYEAGRTRTLRVFVRGPRCR